MTPRPLRHIATMLAAGAVTATFVHDARAAASDFDRNGTADVLWHNGTTGDTQIWYLTGTTRTGFAPVTLPNGDPIKVYDSDNWQVAGVADFNNDQKPDILWHNGATGATQVWFMNNAVRTNWGDLPSYLAMPQSSGWRIVGTADINLDGHPDILWHNGSSGYTQAWYMNGVDRLQNGHEDVDHNNPALVITDSAGWRLVGISDFDGDGHPDFLWHKGDTGETHVWYMNGMTFLGLGTFSINDIADSSGWQIVGTYDVSLDGKPDVLWHNATSGLTQVWFMNGTSWLSSNNITENNVELSVLDSTGWRITEGTNLEKSCVVDPMSCAAGVAFCELVGGACATNASGVCLARPTSCDSTFAPVCACNGRTYSNDCERQAAGVAKWTDGPCSVAGCPGTAPASQASCTPNNMSCVYTTPPAGCVKRLMCASGQWSAPVTVCGF